MRTKIIPKWQRPLPGPSFRTVNIESYHRGREAFRKGETFIGGIISDECVNGAPDHVRAWFRGFKEAERHRCRVMRRMKKGR